MKEEKRYNLYDWYENLVAADITEEQVTRFIEIYERQGFGPFLIEVANDKVK